MPNLGGSRSTGGEDDQCTLFQRPRHAPFRQGGGQQAFKMSLALGDTGDLGDTGLEARRRVLQEVIQSLGVHWQPFEGGRVNIIIVSDKLAQAKTITLGPRTLAVAAVVWVIIPLVFGGVLFDLALNYGVDIQNPYLRSLVLDIQQRQLARSHADLQANLDAMAVKVGQMQAQVTRLDALGDRLVKLSGVNRQEFRFDQLPGRGGAENAEDQRGLSRRALEHQIEELSRQVEERADRLTVLEAMLMQRHLSKVSLPSRVPVTSGWYSSNFGWRIDPFTGRQAYHEGVDFTADVGTPVHAAAGGVVITAEFNNSGYGYLVEVDHGNGLVSRYAHLSKMLVKPGDIVLRGQKIAQVGSTGRSTGPHLHFEVRHHGSPQNPANYLQFQG